MTHTTCLVYQIYYTKNCMSFCTYLECNMLSGYRKETRIEQKYRYKHTLLVSNAHLSFKLEFFETARGRLLHACLAEIY